MAVAMERWPPSLGTLNCCSQPVVGEEVFAPGPLPMAARTPPLQSWLDPLASARSTFGGSSAGAAGWTPRAASLLGAGGGRGLFGPSQELLVDVPLTGRGRLQSPPRLARSLGDRTRKRAKIQSLVQDFVREAAPSGGGRPCWTLGLGATTFGYCQGKEGRHQMREARLELSAEAGILALRRRTNHGDWAAMGSWPVRLVLGVYRAEDSALVQAVVTAAQFSGGEGDLAPDILCRAALLEFGGGLCAAHEPFLIVESSSELRDRLVVALSVLRLCWAARASAGVAESPTEASAFRLSGAEGPLQGSAAPVRSALTSSCDNRAEDGGADSGSRASSDGCPWSNPASPVSATVSPLRPMMGV
eukprot:CAMPEP_0177357666 /NCGR_PEP_ID=MMETSP0368-20130122/35184_1 /TAXON_ID=447022 ORGANISM="Scrippsiella hangoei-like, Strain SHHI-4" /NCGR_SAMPLE_ID=MMETSP0368 /ASSEMBLY_ACC=CAM_ASM_000363 /LENGTH=359 /DNA_ID=CAMNT_0018820087 /DNA_START=106 /DNA_END=1185 /DNA_ORIENTATION=-